VTLRTAVCQSGVTERNVLAICGVSEGRHKCHMRIAFWLIKRNFGRGEIAGNEANNRYGVSSLNHAGPPAA
jgi:hypothetical protein